jgi:hypothetical protein
MTTIGIPQGNTVLPRAPYPVQRLVVGHRWRRRRADRARLASRSPVALVQASRLRPVGFATSADLYRARDVFGRPWGFLHVPSTGHGSVVLRCVIRDGALDDAPRAEVWLAQLGLWLAMLSHEPDLAACVVTLDRSTGPAGAQMWLQLTYQLAGPCGSTRPAAQAAEVAARIPELTRSLTDVGAATAATSDDILGVVTHAYGPSVVPKAVDRRRRLVAPPGSLPLTVQDGWSHVRHAGDVVSRTWMLSQLASSVVLSSALPSMLTIPPEVAGVRIGLLAHESSAASSGYDPQEWTGLSAQALGAATPAEPETRPDSPFSMLVTATVSSPQRLAEAAHAIRDCLATDVQPWLRPLYGDQAVGFAAGLPLGLVPDEHAMPPQPASASDPPRGGRR